MDLVVIGELECSPGTPARVHTCVLTISPASFTNHECSAEEGYKRSSRIYSTCLMSHI